MPEYNNEPKKRKGRPPKLKNPVLMHGIQLEASDKIALIKAAEMWNTSTLDLIRLGIRMIIKKMEKAYAAENENDINHGS